MRNLRIVILSLILASNSFAQEPMCGDCTKEFEKAVMDLQLCNDTTQFKPEWYQDPYVISALVILGGVGGYALGRSLQK